jgi:hypothetical protein
MHGSSLLSKLVALAVGLMLVSGAALARANEPLEPDPDVEPPWKPLPERGVTVGAHVGVGYPFLDAIPAEHALVAATLRVRVGYRFTRAFALYLEGAALLTHNSYTVRRSASDPPEPPDPRRPYSAAPVASIAVAVRPVSWLELSVAPALGVHGTALFGARGHVAVPLRLTSWRFTLAPTVELIGLTGSEWKQLALTGGLGVDW